MSASHNSVFMNAPDRKRLGILVGVGAALLLGIAVFGTVFHQQVKDSSPAVSAAPFGSKGPSGSFQPGRVSAAPAGASASVATAAVTADWTKKYRSSDNYLQFVKDALPAAVSGDGRASWYIAEALRSCALVMKTYKDVADPEAQLNQTLVSMTKAPGWTKDLLAQKTHRCLGLAQEDPFASLPSKVGGYPAAYWNHQAVVYGDPVAQESQVQDALGAVAVGYQLSDTEKEASLGQVDTTLRSVVASGDPDAIFKAGVAMADPQFVDDPLNGLAVALAACDLGHDCSANNTENVFANCKLSGACPADADYAYYLQQSLGPEQFAQVYERSQLVKQAVESGDSDTVMKYLALTKHP